ncbi:MAG: RNA polymerase sigma factor [Lentisphaerales bacterium]|nr:RNA polymerase sigma factor [Lentisphaerales bacterium]
MNWQTRQTLLQRAKDPNNAQAWEEFTSYYKQFIHVVLHQMNFRSADFDDAVQEIMIKIWQNLPKFEHDPNRGQFRTWLSRVIRNRLIDFIKQDSRYKKRVEKATEQYLEEEKLLPESELEKLVTKEWEKHITTCALNNVKELFSGSAIKAFELSLLGKHPKEISETLNIKQDSVRTLKNRVQLRLIKEIESLRADLEF